jgi:hypothetical protein
MGYHKMDLFFHVDWILLRIGHKVEMRPIGGGFPARSGTQHPYFVK